MALIGTPSGFSQSGSIVGHWEAGAVKRAFGWAAGRPHPGSHSLPVQSMSPAGGSFVIPSHHTPPSGVSATFVKIEFLEREAMAFGFVFIDVPGATPKNPASGLIARSRPPASGLSHAMSSPSVHTFHPMSVKAFGGTIIAKLVFPHALGNAAVTYVLSPWGLSTPRMSMCSPIHPWPRALSGAIRSAKHFLPGRALPP